MSSCILASASDASIRRRRAAGVLSREIHGVEVWSYPQSDGWHWEPARHDPIIGGPYGPFPTEADALEYAAALLDPGDDLDCEHPTAARICYRDRAAPLGREGDEWCDACGRRL